MRAWPFFCESQKNEAVKNRVKFTVNRSSIATVAFAFSLFLIGEVFFSKHFLIV